MFHLDVMNKKVANFHQSVVTTLKVSSLLWDSVKHIFLQFSMTATGAILLKVWNRAICKVENNMKESEHAPLRFIKF